LKIYLDCIPCFLRQALEAARMATGDEDTHRKVLNSVANLIPKLPFDVTPPEIAQYVYRIVADITGDEDPCYEAKRQANRLALSLYSRLKKTVANSSDPLLAACKLAIAGNSIDLAPQSGYGDLSSIAESALASPLGIDDYEEFKRSIEKSSHILYLGDNAGEIVFDRILIEELRQVKDFEVYFAVREKPIINDATLHDAISTGMDKVAEIVPSGSDAPATILSQCSPRILQLYHSADITIAKGQGNYESLSDEAKSIFFLLKVKCPVIAGLLSANVGDAVLKSQRL
jgi:uncharacterized protein with ATP-grasp and redox domains